MFRTAMRSLIARKLRLVTTSVAVLLGVAFMAGTLVLTDTIGRTFDDLFTDANAGTDAYVRSAEPLTTRHAGSRARIDAAILPAVAGADGVRAAEGTVEGYAQLVDRAGEPVGNPEMGAPTYGGNWRTTDELNPFTLVEGTAPQAPGQVVIDRKSAEDGGFAVGDEADVLTPAGPERVRITGIASFGGADSPGGASYVLFTTPQAQELLAAPGTFDGIAVVGADGLSEQQVRDNVARAVPAGVEVLTGSQLTDEDQRQIKEDLKFFNTFLMVFALIALFVGSFIIYNTFSIIVAQRARENALLRAIGGSRRQVLGAVLAEAAAVGLFASAAGLVGGIGVAAGLKALLAAMGLEIPAGGVVVSTSTVVVSVVAGLSVSLASAILPARRASKVAPVAAMRDVAVDSSARSTPRALGGLVVAGVGIVALVTGLSGTSEGAVAKVGLGAALIFLGVAVLGPVIARPLSGLIGAPLPRLRGTAGALARQNAMRNPKRTSATASALMIGVGLVGFITIFAGSAKASINKVVDGSMRSDFLIDARAAGHGGLSPALAERLATLPEVAAASPVAMVPAEINGSTQDAVAVDPATFNAVFDAKVSAGDIGSMDARGVAVLDTAAERHGLRLGDAVPVRFPGGEPQSFTVQAIFAESQTGARLADDQNRDYLITRSAALANVAGTTDIKILVTTADGVGEAPARAALDAATSDYPTADVKDREEFKSAQAAQVDMMLNLIYALLALAVIIALIGIANTLALSIYERRRELGLLRAVGMSRQQLRATVRWESVIMALLGTGLGLGIGLFFGWALVQAMADQGVDTLQVPVGPLATIAVVGALAGVVAALLPARRAARLDTLKAISTS